MFIQDSDKTYMEPLQHAIAPLTRSSSNDSCNFPPPNLMFPFGFGKSWLKPGKGVQLIDLFILFKFKLIQLRYLSRKSCFMRMLFGVNNKYYRITVILVASAVMSDRLLTNKIFVFKKLSDIS